MAKEPLYIRIYLTLNPEHCYGPHPPQAAEASARESGEQVHALVAASRDGALAHEAALTAVREVRAAGGPAGGGGTGQAQWPVARRPMQEREAKVVGMAGQRSELGL